MVSQLGLERYADVITTVGLRVEADAKSREPLAAQAEWALA